MNIQEELAKPFGVDDIKSYTAGKAGTLTYIDARSVMNRLDEVVGVSNWQTSYRLMDPEMKAVECTLLVRIDGEWISKADVGFPNEGRDADNADKEPLKAAYSDALKRAAVQFGVGRHLYASKTPAKAAPPASPLTQQLFDQAKLMTLMAEHSVKKEDLIKITGAGANGNAALTAWFKEHPDKTVDDLVSYAVDMKLPA